jgi:hypothetical protein
MFLLIQCPEGVLPKFDLAISLTSYTISGTFHCCYKEVLEFLLSIPFHVLYENTVALWPANDLKLEVPEFLLSIPFIVLYKNTVALLWPAIFNDDLELADFVAKVSFRLAWFRKTCFLLITLNGRTGLKRNVQNLLADIEAKVSVRLARFRKSCFV